MLNKDQVSKLLNRSLTSSEVTNFDMYLKISIEKLEQLLCIKLCDDGSSRTYQTRKGYSSLYIDPFTSVTTVTVDGVEVTDYIVKQNELYNADWYNIIEFTEKMTGELAVVSASWGFNPMPYDLQLLLAKMFNQNSLEQTVDNQVKSKEIEDFKVTYKDATTYDEFINANSATLNKYSQCNVGLVRNGDVRTIR